VSASKRTIVITGGSKGIGRGNFALDLLERVQEFIFVHYDPDDLAANKTLELLDKMNVEARSEKLDVSSFR